MTSVHLGETPVGPEHPPVLLAEIGTIFNQDLDQARQMVERVRQARAACPDTPVILKGEVLHTADICLHDDTCETYHSTAGEKRSERYRELIERKVVSLDQYRRIFGLCPDLPFVLSVYDLEGADFAAEIGAVGLKIASSNITHVPLIRHVAGLGLAVLIDTGRSTMSEIERAVRTAREAGCQQLIVEHSPDGHPALPDNHNLRMLWTLSRAFGAPVGLSDHYDGEEMLYVAVALGASLLEKGITFDPGALEQDVSHAMPAAAIETVAGRIHASWQALGSPVRDLSRPIEKLGTSARMGLIARHHLVAGDTIDLETITFAFPRKGIGVEEWDEARGRTLDAEIEIGTPIHWGHIRRV